jgi:hypothetical protein
VPPRSGILPLKPIDLPAVALDGPLHLCCLTFRDHVVQDLQYRSGPAVKRDLRERQVAPTAAGAVRDGGALVEDPKATQRELGGHGVFFRDFA